jgi:hypothetical protein
MSSSGELMTEAWAGFKQAAHIFYVGLILIVLIVVAVMLTGCWATANGSVKGGPLVSGFHFRLGE